MAIFRCSICPAKAPTMKKLSFFRFPTDPKILKEWMRFIKVKFPLINVDLTSRICSDHFTDSDFERDLRSEMLGLPVKKLLKDSAVPSKKHKKDIVKKHQTQSSIRKEAELQEEHRKQLIEEILAKDAGSLNDVVHFDVAEPTDTVIPNVPGKDHHYDTPHYSETYVHELKLKIEQQDRMIAEADKTRYQLLGQVIALKKQVIESNEERDKCREELKKMRESYNKLKSTNERSKTRKSLLLICSSED